MRYYIKINLLTIAMILFCVHKTPAHTALLFTEDNGDGTVYIEAGLSTGESVSGAKIIIKDKTTGQPISTFLLPDSGKTNIKMPDVPYIVTLDLGVGHIVTKTGPFPDMHKKTDSISKSLPVSGKKSKKMMIILLSATTIICIFVCVYMVLKKKIVK